MFYYLDSSAVRAAQLDTRPDISMTRTRNLHILGALKAGGAERFVVDLLAALRRKGVPVELLCLLPNRDAVGEGWARKLESAGVPIHSGPAVPKMGVPTFRWLAGQLRAPDIDIVHVHMHYCEFAYFAARFLHRRRYRVIRTIHNTSPPETKKLDWAFRHSDIRYSISCGESTHEAYQNMVRGKMVCVPYGIDFDWPQHDHTQRETRLRALGQDPALTHYMQVGRQGGGTIDEAQKAQDDLIKAWKQSGAGKKGGLLHLFGDGNLRAELEVLAAGDPTIIFHGVCDNISEWLGAADTYVMPSRFEGLPLAGIEAVSTGIPCIFSNINSLRELHHSTVLYHEVGDIEGIASCLQKRLGISDDVPREETAAFVARFGIDRPADAYIEAYRDLT